MVRNGLRQVQELQSQIDAEDKAREQIELEEDKENKKEDRKADNMAKNNKNNKNKNKNKYKKGLSSIHSFHHRPHGVSFIIDTKNDSISTQFEGIDIYRSISPFIYLSISLSLSGSMSLSIYRNMLSIHLLPKNDVGINT